MRDVHTFRLRRFSRPVAFVPGASNPVRRRAAAFTLIELLVVMAILALLVAIMVASLARVRAAGKSFVCKNQLKNVAFDFNLFADEWAHPNRGDSEQFGKSLFYVDDFQERQYVVSEFWKVPVAMNAVGVPYKAGEQPMICPAGPQDLQKWPNQPLAASAVKPLTSVSIGLNMRLRQAAVPRATEGFDLVPVRLSKRIKDQAMVPLAFDVDGEKAIARHVLNLPYYSAPKPANVTSGEWRYWYPSLRHGGQCNAAFIDGHVASSRDPAHASGWNWKYQPPVD